MSGLGIQGSLTASSAYPKEKIITTKTASTSDNVYLALSTLETMKLRFNHFIAYIQIIVNLLTGQQVEQLQLIVAFFNIITKIYTAYLNALHEVYPRERAIYEGLSNVFQALFPLIDLQAQIEANTQMMGIQAQVDPVVTGIPFNPGFLLQSLLQSLYDALIYLFALTANLDECHRCKFYRCIFETAHLYLPAILTGLSTFDSSLATSLAEFFQKVSRQLACLPDGKAKCKVYAALIDLLSYILNVALFAGPVSINGLLPVLYDPEQLGRLICRVVKYLPCDCRSKVSHQAYGSNGHRCGCQ